MPQNPAQHARVAADAIARLVNDVKNGRAEWSHQANIKQAVGDLTRLSDDLATALQQMTAGLAQLTPPGPHTGRTNQTVGALHLAGQSATEAATRLRQATRTMH
ncbi:hypothetical protein [Streptomyces sp. NPDC127197]|uniref:hypothetical protein n=1 Tax=Streptomyces sp. NPDC127197 TaxID=3345388 RepID=UPI00362A736F